MKLIKSNKQGDPGIRKDAWAGLAALADQDDMTSIMKAAVQIKKPKELVLAEGAIKEVLARAQDRGKCFQTVDDVERVSTPPQGRSEITVKESHTDRPVMDENSATIMNRLADFYRRQIPQGARFDEERFYEAVWDHFHMWPSVNAAGERIKQTIDVRETVVWG